MRIAGCGSRTTVEGAPYTPAAVVEGVQMKKFADWFVRRQSCSEPVRAMEG